jgi:hypothetical protein
MAVVQIEVEAGDDGGGYSGMDNCNNILHRNVSALNNLLKFCTTACL